MEQLIIKSQLNDREELITREILGGWQSMRDLGYQVFIGEAHGYKSVLAFSKHFPPNFIAGILCDADGTNIYLKLQINDQTHQIDDEFSCPEEAALKLEKELALINFGY